MVFGSEISDSVIPRRLQFHIGVIDFSAGGHVASTLGTHFTQSLINEGNVSLRPDFMILVYPVISFEQFAHAGSRDKLVGVRASSAKLQLFSNEKQVSSDTPVTFLVHASDDQPVSVRNTLVFDDALTSVSVKAEKHLYEAGGHGFGLNNPRAKDKWFDRCKNWLKENGF